MGLVDRDRATLGIERREGTRRIERVVRRCRQVVGGERREKEKEEEGTGVPSDDDVSSGAEEVVVAPDVRVNACADGATVVEGEVRRAVVGFLALACV